MKILKEKGACWSYLRREHRLLECKKKRPCGVNRCTKWYHETLHKDKKKLKPLYKESPDPQVYVTITSQTLAYSNYSEYPLTAIGSMSYGIAELHSISLQMTKQRPSD